MRYVVAIQVILFVLLGCATDRFSAPSVELERRLSEYLKSKDPGPICPWVSRYHGDAPSHQMLITFIEWGNRHVQDMNSLLRRWPKATRCETFDRLKWAATDSGQDIRCSLTRRMHLTGKNLPIFHQRPCKTDVHLAGS